MRALGMIETRGRIGAIVAADTALKTANVSLITFQKITGGIVVIFVEGSVGDVKSAIKSAESEAKHFCKYVNTDVIAQPADQIAEAINEISRGRSKRFKMDYQV